MHSERSQATQRTTWLKAPAFVLLGLTCSFWPREAEAVLQTSVGSFIAPTSKNKSCPGDPSCTIPITVGFQPKAVIFFWTTQTMAGLVKGDSSAGYGFATATTAQHAVSFASNDNLAPTSHVQARWQWSNRCIGMVTGAGASAVTSDAMVTSFVAPANGFTVQFQTMAPLGDEWIVHYMALGGADITNAFVGSFTPATGTGSEVINPTGLTFQPDFLMFLSVDWGSEGKSTDNSARVMTGFAGKSQAHGITQAVATAASPVITGTPAIITSSGQLATAAILEKNADTNPGSINLKAAVTSLNATGFTINKVTNTGTPNMIHFLALKGGQYRVGQISRPTMPAATQRLSYTGVGFTPKGLLFSSTNLSNGDYADEARLSFSAADAATTPNQRATFIHDKIDFNPYDTPNPDGDNSWVSQGTSGDAVPNNGKVVYLAQAGDCPPTFPQGAGSAQCSAGPRVISEADVASYDEDGFTLLWTKNDLANMNQGIGSNESNAHPIYVAFGNNPPPLPLTGFRTKVGSLFAEQFPIQKAYSVGFQPKAVIFFWTSKDTPGATTGAQVGYGFATAAGSERAVNYVSDDAKTLATRSSSRWQWTNRCIVITNTSTLGTTLFEAQLLSMDADGFTLDWVITPGASNSPIVHYLALGGADITDAAVGTFTPTANTGSQNVTGLAFQPDFLMFLSIDSITTGGRVGTDAKVSIGYAANGSSVTQAAYTATTMSADPFVTTRGAQADDAAVVEESETTGNVTFAASVTSFDPNGFTVDKTVNTGGTETPVQFLALRGGLYKVSTITRPTTAGAQSVSYGGVGFAPKALLFTSRGHIASVSDPVGGDAQARISLSAADSTPVTGFNQRATFFHDVNDYARDGDNSMVRQFTSGTVGGNGKAVLLWQPGSCPPTFAEGAHPVECGFNPVPQSISEADVTSYDPDGFTLGWTSNNLAALNGDGGDEAQAQISVVAFGATPPEERVKTKVGSITAPATTGEQSYSVGFTPAAVIFYWTAQTATGFTTGASAGYGFATGANQERAAVYVSDNNVAPATGPYDPVRWQWIDRCVAVVTTVSATGDTVNAAARFAGMTATGFKLNWVAASGTPWIIHYMAVGGDDVTKAAVGTFPVTASSVPASQPVTVGFQPDFLMFLSVDSNTEGSRVATHPKLTLGYAASGLTITQGTHTVAARSGTAGILTTGAQSHYDAIVEIAQAGTPQITFQAAVTSFDPTGFTINKKANVAGTETQVYYLALQGGRYKVGWLLRPETEGASTQSVSGFGFTPSGLLFSAWGEVQSDGYEPPPGATLVDPMRDENVRVNFSAVDSDRNARATFFEDMLDIGGGDNSWVHQGTWGNVGSSKAIYLAQGGDCPMSGTTKYADPATTDQCLNGPSVITDADLASYDANGFTINWTTNDFARAYNIFYPLPAYPNQLGEGYMAEVFYAAFGSYTGGTTEVELSSFTARGLESAVSLEWETATELHNLGFHLYRSLSEAGPWTRITSSLIPGLGSSPVGARYSYTDTGLTNGVRYYYQLEDVETAGGTERHGPVWAIPMVGATTGDPGGDPVTGPGGGGQDPVDSTRVTYGDPSRVSLRVLRRDAAGVDLELTTGGFYATPEADGSMKLEIPGFELQGEPGTPSIPVERTFLEAVAGRQVRITSIVPSDVLSFPWPHPALAGAPELLVSRDGTVQASYRRVPPAWIARHPYPAEAARVVMTAFQGETKKALVELAPLRWNPSTGQLLLTRRLRVRVAFDGIAPGEAPIGGSQGRALPRQGARGSRAGQGLVAHLLARDKGLYAVAFEDAFRYHRRSVPTERLRLSRLGKDVPFHVEPDPSRFAPGSVLYFLSEGGSLSAYTNEAVYELAVGSSGIPMPIVSSPPAGVALTEAVAQRSWEQNQYYMSGLLEAPDVWLWDSIISGLPPKSFPFTLSGLAASSDPAVLSVWLQGATDLPGSPDHHVRLTVNGSYVAEASWDGNSPRRLEALLYPGLLHDGENSLDIDNVADTPVAASLVYLDRFSLDYPRALAAEGGRFEAVFGPPGSASLAGLGAGSLVLDTTNPAPRWLVGSAAGPAGLTLGVEAGHRYLAVSPEAVRRPGIRWPSLSGGDLLSADNQADYLLLAPRELLPAAAPLLQLREEQGLHARVVALEEIYDAFGYGEKSPDAIRDFIAYAYHHWTAPSPRYVLLLGDATYDPKDFTHTGVKDLLPAFMFKSTWLWTASDPAYASVNGEDSIPDLAVGRLPASSLEQAESLVHKLVAFERNGFDPADGAVLVADNPDSAGDFEADTDDIASGPLAGYSTEKIYLRRLGIEPTRSAILAAFDRGASLVSYVGHGAPAIWASERVLHSNDMDKLSPQARQPIVFTMNCMNGYFVPPIFDSLAEALVKADDKGAIAAFSPSGLSLDAAAHVYHKALVAEVASGQHARLGDAVLAAQRDYTDTGVFPELLRVYNLFGDPAMRLR